MKRDRYHQSLARKNPHELADEIVRLRHENGLLRTLVEGTTTARKIIPEPYAKAITLAYFIGIGKQPTLAETPSRPTPTSRPPAHNAAAYDLYRTEFSTLSGRVPFLLNGIDRAVTSKRLRDRACHNPPGAA